jgi:hypothetical protein
VYQVHRRKVRVWQMICVLSHYVEDDIVGEVMLSTHTCLYVRIFLNVYACLYLWILNLLVMHCYVLHHFSISESSICMLVQRNNLPAVRQYLETFAILLYLKFPTLVRDLFML